MLWEADKSVSVVGEKYKGIISNNGDKITYKWPKLGVFVGDTYPRNFRYLIHAGKRLLLNFLYLL